MLTDDKHFEMTSTFGHFRLNLRFPGLSGDLLIDHYDAIWTQDTSDTGYR